MLKIVPHFGTKVKATAKKLEIFHRVGYDTLVTAKSVTGFDSPNFHGGRTATFIFGGFFASVAWCASCLGRAMRGAFGLAGFREAGLSTRMVPSILRLTAQGREKFISFHGGAPCTK